MTAPAIPSAATAARRNRWAVSFADLLMLLLGFFVLLQATGSQRRDAMLAEVSRQFGGRPVRTAIELRAAELFAPGEAMLTPQGQARLRAAVRPYMQDDRMIELRSQGQDRARQRFDDWDLAAARLGAVARALKAQGIGGDRLLIRGLDQADSADGQGQVIRIAPGEAVKS
ncbi:flagellar motor protein MotB [Sphingobium yanoikuyae]|uniref:OmpA/MotB family protein n=1 Tax=Sphingobium yanoikuyae TaxID=13690 RepID=UPI0028A8CDDD|nr:flagellar motor protein MotB [Sphingobium yanoikuyae]